MSKSQREFQSVAVRTDHRFESVKGGLYTCSGTSWATGAAKDAESVNGGLYTCAVRTEPPVLQKTPKVLQEISKLESETWNTNTFWTNKLGRKNLKTYVFTSTIKAYIEEAPSKTNENCVHLTKIGVKKGNVEQE